MDTLNFPGLPFSSKARICWGFFWRGLVITIGSSLCGGLLGGIAGFIFGMFGLPKGAAIAGGLLGAVAGVIFLYLWIRWLLVSRIGKFKLVLVHAQEII